MMCRAKSLIEKQGSESYRSISSRGKESSDREENISMAPLELKTKPRQLGNCHAVATSYTTTASPGYSWSQAHGALSKCYRHRCRTSESRTRQNLCEASKDAKLTVELSSIASESSRTSVVLSAEVGVVGVGG